MHCVLALDTALPFLSAALRHGTENVYSFSGMNSNSHSEEIENRVGELLSQASIEPSEIDYFILGAGPGSFTGLRIGFSFLKGMCFALEKPLVSVSTLKAMAFRQLKTARLVVAIIDARRGEFFSGGWTLDCHGGIVEVLPEEIRNADALHSELSQMKGFDDIVVVSHDLSLIEKWDFSKSQVFGLGEALIILGEGISRPSDLREALLVLEPCYLRAPAAKTIAERRGF